MTRNQKSKKKKVIFISTDQLGIVILDYLVDHFSPQLVVTAPPARVGRGRKQLMKSPIQKRAEKLDLPLITPKKLGSIAIKKINSYHPDFILIYGYGKIIPLEKLNCSEVLNIHPSLLPKLRGPSPIRYSILRGYRKTGVSLMKIDQQIDHGPVIGQEKIEVSPDETGQSLRKKVNQTALELVQKNLADYLTGKISTQPQDHSQATFTPLIRKKDGEIDWEKPIEHIERKIRAFNPWPGSYTHLNQQIFKIYSAKIKKGKLHLGQVQLSGRKKMSFQEFKQGFQGRLDFSDKIA